MKTNGEYYDGKESTKPEHTEKVYTRTLKI